MSSEDAVLSVLGLRAYYRLGVFGIMRDVRALDDITFEVRRGEIYGLVGESSSGKTTLMRVLTGTAKPPLKVLAGYALYDFRDRSEDIVRSDAEALRTIRWKHLACLMPGHKSVLNPVRRVRQSFGDFAFHRMGLSRRAFAEAVQAQLARVHLDPATLEAYPHELSAGMRQRVTMALATLAAPEVVIADEPTMTLDAVEQKEVLVQICDVQRTLGCSFLLITPEMAVQAAVADRIGILYAGRLVEEAPTAAIFRHPRHPYTTHLIASLPRLGDTAVRSGLAGRPPSLTAPPRGCRFFVRCPQAKSSCGREAPPLVNLGGDHRVACFAAAD